MIHIKGWDVQFLPTFDDLTDEAVKNAVYFEVERRIRSGDACGVFIAIALKTGRSKDFARVKMFMEETYINQELIKHWSKI